MRIVHGRGFVGLRDSGRADPLPVPETTALDGAAPRAATGPYGLPASLFARLWSLDDVCAFAGVERTKARELLASHGAPPRLRMGSRRCDRWNPVLLVMWLHGDDWTAIAAPAPTVLHADGAAPCPDAPSNGPEPAAGPPARGGPPGRPWPADGQAGAR